MTRSHRAFVFFAWLLGCSTAFADVAVDRLTAYNALPSHKAIATTIDPAATAYGSVSGHASESAAAIAAFQSCESQRQARGIAEACEIVRVNDDVVATGASIKARAPKARHPLFMWDYSRPPSRVFLVGSMHVMKPSIHPLPAQFEGAFAASDRVVVEVNTLAVSPQQMQGLLRAHALLPAGQTVSALLPPDTLRALEAYLTTQGVSLGAVAQMKPALVATQLAVGRLTALGYFSQFGLDQYYMARADTRPILELERVEDQMALLTSPSMDVQVDMLDITLAQMNEIEAMVADMVVAWLAGDEAALRELFDEQSPPTEAYRAFNRRLLDDRNVGMADKIQGYLATPGTYFVLVGAAHLAGEHSIVDVLRQRGVVGKRIYSDDQI